MPSQHPKEWSKKTHYGQCGQSCPCCRAFVSATEKDAWEHGSCPICLEVLREWKKVACKPKSWADDEGDELPPLPNL
jgi:hypothetical protein